jgi:hypothetical protein
MAVLFGWMIIVPPFIAVYNTAKHIEGMERRVGVSQTIESVLALLSSSSSRSATWRMRKST